MTTREFSMSTYDTNLPMELPSRCRRIYGLSPMACHFLSRMIAKVGYALYRRAA